MFYTRSINFNSTLKRKSIFLLGPRQTGKSTFLKENYPNSFYIDLLKPSTFQKYRSDIDIFTEEIEHALLKTDKQIIIIDEIQKMPELLDEVHRLIEIHKTLRFILTGSSARKLKRSGVNLLGGRASKYHMNPITSQEIGIKKCFENFEQKINFGFLPSILTSENPWEDLNDYVGIYLKEEIQNEGIIRSLNGFSRFLNSVALTNAEQVNFTGLGNDAGVPPRTVREYYHVLEDTLVGHLLPAFQKTIKRKAMTSAKFYLFDPGVTNVLLKRKTVSLKTKEFGNLFEQFIFCELKAFIDYNHQGSELFYWRSTSKFEVDFVILTPSGKYIGIEVKSSANPSSNSYRGLLALNEEIILDKKIVIAFNSTPRLIKNGIEVIPPEIFLEQLWDGDLIK